MMKSVDIKYNLSITSRNNQSSYLFVCTSLLCRVPWQEGSENWPLLVKK